MVRCFDINHIHKNLHDAVFFLSSFVVFLSPALGGGSFSGGSLEGGSAAGKRASLTWLTEMSSKYENPAADPLLFSNLCRDALNVLITEGYLRAFPCPSKSSLLLILTIAEFTVSNLQ